MVERHCNCSVFCAIRTHGHKIKVPPRSRQEFERQRDAFKRGDPIAILLAPHLAYSGGLYESGVKGGSVAVMTAVV